MLHRVYYATLAWRRLTRHVHNLLTGVGGSSTESRPIHNLTIVGVVVDGLTAGKIIVLHDDNFTVRVLIAALLPTALLHAELLRRVVRRIGALRHDRATRVLLVEAVCSLSRQNTLVHFGRGVGVLEMVTVADRLTLRRILHLLVHHHLLRARRPSSLEAQVAVLVRRVGSARYLRAAQLSALRVQTVATDAANEAVRRLLPVGDSTDTRMNVLEVLRRSHGSSCLLCK